MPAKNSTARKTSPAKKVTTRKTASKQTSNKAPTKKAPSKAQAKSPPVPSADAVVACEVTQEKAIEPDVWLPCANAISVVSFDEAMQIAPLIDAVDRHARFELMGHLTTHGGDVLAASLAGAALYVEHGTVIVRFSAQASKLWRAKELRIMGNVPTLVNKAGKVVENGRLTGMLTKGTRVAANLAAAAVTVAHIISGADIAKKLNKLDGKVDFLVACRRIDQVSRIEAIFRQARELLHMEQTPQIRLDLHRLGESLFELRSTWRREIAHHVGKLEKPEESSNWLVATAQSFTRKGKDMQTVSAVVERDEELRLINGSIAVHLALSQAAGTLDTFLHVSLPDEIAELERVRALIHQRYYHIHRDHSELRAQISGVCARLDNITNTFRPMCIPADAPRQLS